jgi:hypothetical protein
MIFQHKERDCMGTGKKEEPMRRAIIGAFAAAAIALAPLCIPPAHADPIICTGITDPAAHRACNDRMHRYQMGEGECQSSPMYGQVGQFCRNSWVRKSAPASRHPGADTV